MTEIKQYAVESSQWGTQYIILAHIVLKGVNLDTQCKNQVIWYGKESIS